LDSGDDGVLAGIALAGDVTLDGADGDALIGQAAKLAPGRQMGEETPEDVCRVGAGVAPHLLEVDGGEPTRRPPELIEPVAEAQIAHAATIEAARAERHRAADHGAVGEARGPAGPGAEVEGEDGWAAGRGWGEQARHGAVACRARDRQVVHIRARLGQSRLIHDDLQ